MDDTEDKKSFIIDSYRNGVSVIKISEEIDISRWYIYKVLKKYRIKRRHYSKGGRSDKVNKRKALMKKTNEKYKKLGKKRVGIMLDKNVRNALNKAIDKSGNTQKSFIESAIKTELNKMGIGIKE